MTREEILGMSTDQLAEATAVHVMGWIWCEPTITWNAVSSGYWWSLSLEEPVFDWNPGKDISAAWEVVERMKDKGAEINVGYYEQWDCGIDYPIGCNWRAEGMTAPEAICKAALLAVLEG